MPRHIKMRTCSYCFVKVHPHRITRDHVIPKWALRCLPKIQRIYQETVDCCTVCNNRKSGLPLVIFLQFIGQTREIKKLQAKWTAIQTLLQADMEGKDESLNPLRDHVTSLFNMDRITATMRRPECDPDAPRYANPQIAEAAECTAEAYPSPAP